MGNLAFISSPAKLKGIPIFVIIMVDLPVAFSYLIKPPGENSMQVQRGNDVSSMYSFLCPYNGFIYDGFIFVVAAVLRADGGGAEHGQDNQLVGDNWSANTVNPE